MFKNAAHIVVLVLCFTSLEVSCQKISGQVRSDSTGVAFAIIRSSDGQRGVITDEHGKFEWEFQGHEQLHISAQGYLPAAWSGDIPPQPWVIEVEVDPVMMREIVISEQMSPLVSRSGAMHLEVLSKEGMKGLPAKQVGDVLHYLNGVQQVIACGVCGTNDIHINGMEGAYTLVLIDGMPILGALASVYGLNGISPAMIERIELIKGPSSSSYGAESIGGVINIITRQPRKGDLLHVGYGLSTYAEMNLDLGGSISMKKSDLLWGANFFRYQNGVDRIQDNFTDIPLSNRQSLFLKWKWRQPNVHSVALRLYHEERFGGQMNWSISNKGSDSIYGEWIETSRAEWFGSSSWGNWHHDFSWTGHLQESYYGIRFLKATQGVGFNTLYFKNTYSNHHLKTGITNRVLYYDDSTPVDIIPWQSVPGIYAEDDWKPNERWTIHVGQRLDYFRAHGLVWSPQLHVKWKPTDKWSIRWNSGRGFRPVQVFTEDHAALSGSREVQVPDRLFPERAWNATCVLSREWIMKESYGLLEAEVFTTALHHKIFADYDQNPNAIVYYNISGYTWNRGAAVSWTHQWPQKMWIRAGAQVLQVRAQDENGQQLRQPFVPNGSAVVQFRKIWGRHSLEYACKWLGEMVLPDAPEEWNREEVSKPFANHSIQWSFDISPSWHVSVQCRNIFDRVQGSPLVSPDQPFSEAFDTSFAYGNLQHRNVYFTLEYHLVKP